MEYCLPLKIEASPRPVCDVVISDEGIAGSASRLFALTEKHFFLVFDEAVKTHAEKLAKALRGNGATVTRLSLASKEANKSLKTAEKIFSSLVEAEADGATVLIGVGGGVITDLVGFCAALYRRGIRWAAFPTTLVAQVDAAIGGKTAVNLPAGKNLIGAFYQPAFVWADTTTLKTLSDRDRVSGLGEMVKMALCFDSAYFTTLETNWESIVALKSAHLLPSMQKAIDWKVKTVARDERETTGLRRSLNLGHTFGHALEAATQYKVFRHGEAVLHGIRFALALSKVRGHWKGKDATRVEALLKKIPNPPIPADLTLKKLLPFLKRDKKNTRDSLGFVLMTEIGKLTFDPDVSLENLSQAFSQMQGKGAAR